MKLPRYLIPATGIVGAAMMTYNAGINIGHQHGLLDTKAAGFGTSELNFMGAQDMLIASALLLSFISLLRGTYLKTHGYRYQTEPIRWYRLSSALLLSISLYGLTAGFFDCGVPCSKIGDFHDNDSRTAGYALFYSVMTLASFALLGKTQVMANRVHTSSKRTTVDL